jgi:hypothetical protein
MAGNEGKKNAKGFPSEGSGKVTNSGSALKDGHSRLDYDMDPHDMERNPRNGLKGKTNSTEDMVDYDNDRDDASFNEPSGKYAGGKKKS